MHVTVRVRVRARFTVMVRFTIHITDDVGSHHNDQCEIQYSACMVQRTSVYLWFAMYSSVRITWKPEYAGPPRLFSLPHRTNAVAENLGTQGPHTYFSVIRLLMYSHLLCQYNDFNYYTSLFYRAMHVVQSAVLLS